MNRYKNTNDEELFLLIKKNNSEALKVLFEKYFHNLCGFSYNYVKSVPLSEEVVADVFFKIWVNRNVIEIRSSLKSYLFTATRNISINYIARENKHFENLEVLEREHLSKEDNPDEVFNFRELESVIESVIQKLPPKRQTVFRMNRLHGLSYKEIAEVLSISVNTVQNHMVKAIEFMANQYPKIKSIFTILLFIWFH